MPNKTLEARNCVRAFLGDGPATPEALSRLMEYFYVHDFSPLQQDVIEMRNELTGINATLVKWQASLRTLVIVCSIVGGLISAMGTIVGIYIAFLH